MTEMHTWVLITPLPERAWFLLAASSSFSLFLQHSHKSPGEHLHSKQHEMNVDLAKQHWKLVIYMSCTSRNNLLNEDAACLTPKVGPDLFNWYPGSFCSVAKDSFLCRAAEFSCVCAAFWTSIFFSCGYRKPWTIRFLEKSTSSSSLPRLTMSMCSLIHQMPLIWRQNILFSTSNN